MKTSRNAGLALAWMLASFAFDAAAAGDWDGFLRVPAFAVGPGQWLTCDKGAAFVFTSAGKVPERRCVQRKGIRERAVGEPMVLPLQGVLDRHAERPAGHRLVAVGPLPALHEGLGVNSVDPASIFIAYRLAPQ
jgi:hypothetical protein